ncbi:MAG: hypothetical protein R3F61_21720 [Myxococcota bacterium]
MRLACSLALLSACTGETVDTDVTPLAVDVRGEPEVSGCADSASLVYTVGFPSDVAGPARLVGADGTVLWEGLAGLDVPVAFDWDPERGPVHGRFEVGGKQVDVVLPFDVRAPEPPQITEAGLWNGSVVLDQAAVDVLSAASPWIDAVAVGAVGARFSDPHADLGVVSEVVVRACDADGVCELLDGALAGDVWLADLADLADARCADLDDRTRDLFEVQVISACGDDSASVLARVVHDDCDGDGVSAVSDCFDELAGVTALGDIVADGVPVGSLAEAWSAADVSVCGGTHAGGGVVTSDLTLRGVGADVPVVLPPATGPTLQVVGGHVVLSGIDLEGGDAGALGGGALSAELAGSLVLDGVSLRGGSATRGGNLLGPANGDLVARGGRWVGGAATDGGNAWLSGGELRDVEVLDGSALGDGGGVYTTGSLVAVDVHFAGHTAVNGASLYLDHAGAQISGCDLDGGVATGAGGGIAGVLDAGQILDLRVSIVDLSLPRFRDSSAGIGGAVWLAGGALESVLAEIDGTSAGQGGGFFLEGVAWSDSGSAFLSVDADQGAAAVVSGGTGTLVGTTVVDGAALEGALYVTGGATVDVQVCDLTASGCAVWIAGGTVTGTANTGASTPADVCGVAFESAYAPVCSELGCP